MTTPFIDTHAHLDGEEFCNDLPEVMARAKEAGVAKVFLPAIDLATTDSVLRVCDQYPGFAFPMVGLHPEEVKADWREALDGIRKRLEADRQGPRRFIAIGEVGLDYY